MLREKCAVAGTVPPAAAECGGGGEPESVRGTVLKVISPLPSGTTSSQRALLRLVPREAVMVEEAGDSGKEDVTAVDVVVFIELNRAGSFSSELYLFLRDVYEGLGAGKIESSWFVASS